MIVSRVQYSTLLCALNKRNCPSGLWPAGRRKIGNSFPQEYVCIYVCMVTHIARVRINRVRLPILLVVSSTGKMNIPLSPFAPENLVSRDGFGTPVPRQPAHLHTQGKSGAQLRDSSRVPRRRPFIYLNRHTPSGQSRYRVKVLRTDGVHCRESACTGPVNTMVVPNGCCLGSVTMDQFNMRLSFPHPLYYYWYEVVIAF